MSIKRSLALLCWLGIVSVLAASCGAQPATLPAVPPSATIPAATETLVPAPTEEASPTAAAAIEAEPTLDPAAMAACKVAPHAFTNVGFGLPNPAHKMRSVGTVKTIVLFADFADVPAQQTPEELFASVSPNAEKFYKDISYGKMDYVLEPYFTWLRLSQPSAHYGEGIRTYEGHLEFIQEAVNLADPNVDFSTADSVLVLVPPQATSIPYGPAFGANAGQGYTADGKVFTNGLTSGADLPNWGFLWLNHETGHTLGLPDLYLYGQPDNQFRHVGAFSIMGNIAGSAPEFFAFERWQLGWLDDSQIVCITDAEQTIGLTAIEIPGGTKAVMIPLSDSRVLVIESRRRLGYDTALVKEGALVYTVDTAVASGQGTLAVQPETPNNETSPLAVGESVTVMFVTITALEATPEGDTVKVTVAK